MASKPAETTEPKKTELLKEEPPKEVRTVLGFSAPGQSCADRKCPFHGELAVKKEFFRGKVVKCDINRSATIEWSRPHYVPKYERVALHRSRLRVHNPACINAVVGEEVLVAKTRPLSKMKHHVIIQRIIAPEKVENVGSINSPNLPSEKSEKIVRVRA